MQALHRHRRHHRLRGGTRRNRRLVSVALMLATLTAVTACAGAPAETEPAPTESTVPGDDRDASIYYNKFRVCIQNKTSGNLDLEWDSYMGTEQGNYLSPDQVKTTLGPEAFSCAVSHASLTIEGAEWTVGGYAMFAEVDTRAWYVYAPGWKLTLEPNAPVTQVIQAAGKPSLLIEASTNGALRTFDKVTAYPIDVRLFEPPSD